MPPEPFHILIAVEDANVRRSLVESLTAAGFRLQVLDAVAEVIPNLRESPCDAVLLGIDASTTGGIDTCRALRDMLPELGIVAVRTGDAVEADVRALDAGADDCVSPPLRFREVVARVSAVLRRVRTDGASKAAMIRAGELCLDTDRRRFWRGDVEVRLSPREFELLLLFMKNPGVILTHARILRGVWGGSGAYNAGHLRSYIKTLRQKVERDSANPEYIVTEPWVGYRFQVPR